MACLFACGWRRCPAVLRSRTPFLTRPVSSCSSCSSPETLTVLLSQSSGPLTNLALERWLLAGQRDFSRCAVLLVSRSAASVLIGRHQNPWLEVDAGFLQAAGVPLARTHREADQPAYQDLGAIGLTFFSGHGQRQQQHVQLVAETLRNSWGLDVTVGEDNTLVLNGTQQVSTFSSSLTENTACTHCNLLVRTDTNTMHRALRPAVDGAGSGAPQLSNLGTGDPSITIEKVVAAIGQMFLKQGSKQANRGFQMVNPTDEWFPGVAELERQLANPAWVYGQTPQFTHSFRLASCSDIRIMVEVTDGRITAVEPLRPDNSSEMTGTEWVRSILPSASPERLTSLLGRPYSQETHQQAEQALLALAPVNYSLAASDKRVLAL